MQKTVHFYKNNILWVRETNIQTNNALKVLERQNPQDESYKRILGSWFRYVAWEFVRTHTGMGTDHTNRSGVSRLKDEQCRDLNTEVCVLNPLNKHKVE